MRDLAAGPLDCVSNVTDNFNPFFYKCMLHNTRFRYINKIVKIVHASKVDVP